MVLVGLVCLTHMCHVGFDSRVEHPMVSIGTSHIQVEFYEDIETPQVTGSQCLGWNRPGDVMLCYVMLCYVMLCYVMLC